jgi:hypothetical protein
MMRYFLFTIVPRPDLGPTQPPIQWVTEALSLGAKRPGREADHSPPSSAEVNNGWGYTSTLPIRLNGMVLSKAQGQLCLYSSKHFLNFVCSKPNHEHNFAFQNLTSYANLFHQVVQYTSQQ